MSTLLEIFKFVLHIDEYLVLIINQYGALTYGILFLIIFAETGFVVTPFLPGDSLLFAVGALSALGVLNFPLLWLLLVVAGIAGDTVNYWLGHFFGQKIVANKYIPINQSHIDKTEEFYKKHGGKAIILARFVPIVRTFAPFVAGVGKMNYQYFLLYNVAGSLLWITIFTGLGYFFGNLPFVQKHFELVVVVIIILSLVPMVYEFWQDRRHKS